jgi:hypothetical protein
MGDNQVFFDVHQVIDANIPQLWELLSSLLEESADFIPFLALDR